MKGQVSVEYIMVVALVMLVMVPAGYLFTQYSQSSTAQISENQLFRIGNEMVSAAERAYYAGPGARSTISAQFPSGIRNITILSDWELGISELVMSMVRNEQTATYVFSSEVNINATVLERNLGAGLKNVHFESYNANEPFVLITFDQRCPESTDFDLNRDGALDCADRTLFDDCVGAVRPTENWDDTWYTCFRADYDGNCSVSVEGDEQLLSAEVGICS